MDIMHDRNLILTSSGFNPHLMNGIVKKVSAMLTTVLAWVGGATMVVLAILGLCFISDRVIDFYLTSRNLRNEFFEWIWEKGRKRRQKAD